MTVSSVERAEHGAPAPLNGRAGASDEQSATLHQKSRSAGQTTRAETSWFTALLIAVALLAIWAWLRLAA